MGALFRFWNRVDTSAGIDECRPWTGSKYSSGHGRFVVEGTRQQGAHRWVMDRLAGGLGSKELVCHRCDNPPCCNPNHLYIGSYFQNVQDRENRGRSGSGKVNAAKTHCPQGHEYIDTNTLVKRGMRNCRTCHRDRERQRRFANRGDESDR